MLHHIRQTADGFISLVGGLGFFTISATAVDTTMKIVSFALGCVTSVLASIYYVKAIKEQKKGKR